MSQKTINLNFQFVIKQIEDVLQEYSEHPYQAAFAIPELRQKLIAHVFSQISNKYKVIENAQEPLRITNYLYPPLERHLRIEVLIRGGILHLLRENADWVGCHIYQKENSGNGSSQ